ncbi:MAG: hypothetical protein GY778_28220, partial [bacterium]|nr:hypothetical protein [bacterium]
MALPQRTIGSGIDQAVSLGRDHVYVSKGLYDEGVVLADGVSVWGGYDAAADWQRGFTNTVQINTSSLSGSDLFGVRGSNIISPTTGGDLVITTGNNGMPGGDNYAVHCSTCSGLILVRNTITADAAGPGTAGADGSGGPAGADGGPGGAGSCRDSTPGSGGMHGASFRGRRGGDGG